MSDFEGAPTPPSHPPASTTSPAVTLLKKLLDPQTIPGWTGLLLSVLFGIANWKGFVDLYLPAIEAVIGVAAANMLEALSSPGVSIVLAFLSGFYLWLVSVTKHPNDRQFFAMFTWALLAMFVIPFGSLALFGQLVTSSNIPAAVRYYELQQYERRLDPEQREKLYAAFRKVADRLPAFNVSSARNPEAMQYANDFMGVFFGAGLHLESQSANPVDLMSPTFRGVLIGVTDHRAPPPPALVLRDALQAGGISAYFVNMPVTNQDQFRLLVGLK